MTPNKASWCPIAWNIQCPSGAIYYKHSTNVASGQTYFVDFPTKDSARIGDNAYLVLALLFELCVPLRILRRSRIEQSFLLSRLDDSQFAISQVPQDDECQSSLVSPQISACCSSSCHPHRYLQFGYPAWQRLQSPLAAQSAPLVAVVAPSLPVVNLPRSQLYVPAVSSAPIPTHSLADHHSCNSHGQRLLKHHSELMIWRREMLLIRRAGGVRQSEDCQSSQESDVAKEGS